MTDMLGMEVLDRAGLPGEPDNNLVMFYSEAVENKSKSRAAGRPIFEEVDFVKIVSPGNRLDEFISKATPEYQERYPDKWRAYKEKGEERHMEGTPLWQCGFLNKGQVAELEHANVYVVEQLANISDQGLQDLGPGWMRLRELAKKWMELTKSSAPLVAMENTIEQQKGQIATLEGTVAALQQQVNQLMTAEAPKRGRPPGSKNKDAA